MYFLTGEQVARQRFWIKNYLEPYRNKKSIFYWFFNPAEYQKIDRMKTEIEKAALLCEDIKIIPMSKDFELTEINGIKVWTRKKTDYSWIVPVWLMFLFVMTIWLGLK